MTQPSINLRSLDMLRGILAVYVLLGHCRWLLWAGHSTWMSQPHAAWLEPIVYASAGVRYGREAVMVFFVLSGFFIHLRMAEQQSFSEARFSTGGFFRRRAHRLGAAYVFALVATILCDAIGRVWFPTLYLASTGDSLTDAIFSHTGYSWRAVAPALVVLPSSLGHDFGTNGPLWSLAYEVVYYALYPAWFALRRQSAWLAFVAVPAVCLALAFLPDQSFPVIVLSHYPVWLAGAVLAEALSHRKLITMPLVIASMVFAGGFALHLLGHSVFLSAVAAILFGGSAVYAFAALPQSALASVLGRALEFLGERSYSIYILHFPFVALLSAAVIELHGGRPISGWLAAAGAVSAVAFACLGFELCERHFVHHRAPATKLAA